jgi:hypothetical protein
VLARLYESVWLRCGGDPLERILRRVDSWGGSVICPFRLPGRTSSDAEVAFELTLLPTLAKPERSIAFSWRHHWRAPLPSLFGTITASRADHVKRGEVTGAGIDDEYANGLIHSDRLQNAQARDLDVAEMQGYLLGRPRCIPPDAAEFAEDGQVLQDGDASAEPGQLQVYAIFALRSSEIPNARLALAPWRSK